MPGPGIAVRSSLPFYSSSSIPFFVATLAAAHLRKAWSPTRKTTKAHDERNCHRHTGHDKLSPLLRYLRATVRTPAASGLGVRLPALLYAARKKNLSTIALALSSSFHLTGLCEAWWRTVRTPLG